MLIDLIKFFIGSAILVFILWVLIKTHLYFSKDNVPIVLS
jgi:hypothetical protein